MKIVQINACCNGSTGRTSVELATELERCGHECYIAFSEGPNLWHRTIKVGNVLDHKTHAILSRIFGLQGYFSYFATKNLIKRLKLIKPDIVHLRNLHANYINLPLLFKYLRENKIATVVTLHDCWLFTGKCTHYTARGCYKWKAVCDKCPAMKSDNPSLFFDFSKKMFRDRLKWFGQIEDLYVIGVSKWTALQATHSPIFRNAKQIDYIYNWVNTSVFRPTGNSIKSELGINSDSKLVLFVSAGWTKSKVELLNGLSEVLGPNYTLVAIGFLPKDLELNKGIIHKPYINSIDTLAECYSAADVYVHLSQEDTFGKVVAEALACGTPAVVHRSTALPELVDDNTGIIVDRLDIESLHAAITEITNTGKETYRPLCRERAVSHFEKDRNVLKYLSLYQDILNQQC